MIQQNLKEVRELQKVEDRILKRLNKKEQAKYKALERLESLRVGTGLAQES